MWIARLPRKRHQTATIHMKQMNKAPEILKLDPDIAIPGGEVAIDCAEFDTSDPTLCTVWFGNERAPLVALSSTRVLAIVPEMKHTGEVAVALESQGVRSAGASMIVGRRLAEDLHPVTNPAFDTDDGALFVTRSGSRGEQLPITLFRIDVNGEITEFSGDITNPTGIAFDSRGQMFVSSRMDGSIYRITPFKEAVPFAHGLGVATGIAFDNEDTMYVGDRTGTIYKVNGIGEETQWVQLEPSVSAYHLTVGPDDALYVTGPTVASFDSVTRVAPDGSVSVFYKGLGRPQGLAFDPEGSLLVAASLRGRRGIVKITPDGKHAEMFLAGMNLVGLAFSSTGDLVVASTDAVYSVALGPAS
jgi:sugar lactone lactonase YvrE